MTYNKEFERKIGNLSYILYEMKDVEYGTNKSVRYFVEVWDSSIDDPKMALIEKREYGTRNSAMKKIRMSAETK